MIICFYNEHPATLFRSITTILSRTQRALLHEIILVNDFSEYPPSLHQDTEKFVAGLKDARVRLYRTSQREGLIRARMFGAKHATGKVLRLLNYLSLRPVSQVHQDSLYLKKIIKCKIQSSLKDKLKIRSLQAQKLSASGT